MPEPDTLGADFARALAIKDFGQVTELLHPEIDFRGMTPNRTWEASDPDGVNQSLTGLLLRLEAARDGRIGWMRVLCSGFRPVSGE
jgi:hypothetical protein